MSILGSIVQSSGSSAAGASAWVDSNASANVTLSGDNNLRVFANTTSNTVDITLPSGSQGQSIRVIDSGENSGTNIITLVGTIDGVANATIQTDGASLEVTYNGSTWESSGGFENFFERDASTNIISPKSPDTLQAQAITGGNSGSLAERSVTASSFSNVGANVNVSVAGQYSNDTGEATLNTFDASLPVAEQVPASIKYYDENNALITGTGKINVSYNIDGAGFSGLVQYPTTITIGSLTAGANSWGRRINSLGLSGSSVALTGIKVEGSTGTETIKYFHGVPNSSNWDLTEIGSESVSFSTGTIHGIILSSPVTVNADNDIIVVSMQGSGADFRYVSTGVSFYLPGSITGSGTNQALSTDANTVVMGVTTGVNLDLQAFKALANLNPSSSLAIRTQLVGTQIMKRFTINTPNSVVKANSVGALGTYVDDVLTPTVFLFGVQFPAYTTAQRNALAGMTAGTTIFNATTSKLNFYTGSAWEAITSA